MSQQDRGQLPPSQEGASIVGAWRVDAEGAPFVLHIALFHADGTLLIHNPDAGNPQTSDSLGGGAWKVAGEHKKHRGLWLMLSLVESKRLANSRATKESLGGQNESPLG